MGGARHAARANQRRQRDEEDVDRETAELVHRIEDKGMGWHGWWKLVVDDCGFVWERRVGHVRATVGADMGN